MTAVLIFRFGFPTQWNDFISKFKPNGVEGNPDGDLAVHFLDVGQGDCIIIQLPDGKNAIIDAGGNNKNTTSESCEQRIVSNINELKITKFDYMILSHTDTDHVEFMSLVLEKCDVSNIYRPAFTSKNEEITTINSKYATISNNDSYDNFVSAVENEVEEIGAKVEFNIGKNVIDGNGYRFDIYGVEEKYYTKEYISTNFSAEKKNKVSPMVLLSYNAENDVRKIMFTGDAEGKDGNGGEKLFLDKYATEIANLDIDLLKVGHHGSSSSASEDFLDRLDPEYAVISVGVTSGSYGHPNQNCLDRLANYSDGKGQKGIQVYMTKECGDIIFRVNKKGVMTFDTDIDRVAV